MNWPAAARRWVGGLDLWERLFASLLVTVFAVICLTFQDYGVAWDDEYSRMHGADYLRWFASGFTDRAVLSRAANEYLYGAAFHGPAAAFAFVSPLRPYESIHLLIALTGFVGLCIVFGISKRLAGTMAGFFAAAILVLTPTYYGHWFINPKDLPFAVAYLGAILMLLKVYDRLPKPGSRHIAVTAIVMGCALGIRVGGVMLLGYVLVMIALWHIFQLAKQPRSQVLKSLPWTLGVAIRIVALAWGVMIFWWPFAQLDPIRGPLYALGKSTSFDGAGFMNLYRGSFVRSAMIPREYLPYLLLRTLPEFYVAGIGLAALAVVRWISRHRKQSQVDWANAGQFAFLGFVAAFPILAAVIVRPTVYDSTRLFLFVIPPLSILAGIGLSDFIRRIQSRSLKFVVVLLGLSLAVLVAVDMIRTHPYQYVFFNRSSGGLKKADGLFDTEYWGTSHKEGIEWLKRNYRRGAPSGSIGIANPSNPFLTAYYLMEDVRGVERFRHSDIRDAPDIILALTRWNQHLVYGGKIIHIVERMNVPFLYVIESTSSGIAEDSTMKVAAELLYVQKQPLAAVPALEAVLRMNRSHYGALIALATARQAVGDSAEARLLWKRVERLAGQYGDTRALKMARERAQ